MAKSVIFQIGQTLVPEQLGQREMDIKDLHKVVRSNWAWAASWAFREAVELVKNKVYRFTVSGYKHKGYVYIILDWTDTFTIYYTNRSNVVKKKNDMVYIFDLLEVLNCEIERQSDYVR